MSPLAKKKAAINCRTPSIVASIILIAIASACLANEETDVAAIRKNQPVAADAGFVRAIRRIDERRGLLAFDRGTLTGVDLSSGRISVADDDLAWLAALPHVRVLKISGGEITNAGIEHVARLGGLVELAIQDAQIDDAGCAA